MTPFEREYFVSRIRSGIMRIKVSGLVIRVLPPTKEDELVSNEIFMDSIDAAMADGIMTEDEMQEWMYDKKLWTKEQDDKIETIKKNDEKLKVEIFNNRFNHEMVDQIRLYLRAGDRALAKLTAEKNELFSKTCEGIAAQDRLMSIFSNCCYVGDQSIDMEEFDLSALIFNYNNKLLDEEQLRELARTDPWRLHWLAKDYCPLFANIDNRELSQDQKGILVWATMYDNIHESMDCPTEDVIKDDDMLDGWFIIQKRKNESEKAKSEMEKRINNEKIANADDILIVANSDAEINQIHGMNSVGSERIRKQRMATVKSRGKVKDTDFKDRQMEIRSEINQKFRDQRR